MLLTKKQSTLTELLLYTFSQSQIPSSNTIPYNVYLYIFILYIDISLYTHLSFLLKEYARIFSVYILSFKKKLMNEFELIRFFAGMNSMRTRFSAHLKCYL